MSLIVVYLLAFTVYEPTAVLWFRQCYQCGCFDVFDRSLSATEFWGSPQLQMQNPQALCGGWALSRLSTFFFSEFREFRQLNRITQKKNAGVLRNPKRQDLLANPLGTKSLRIAELSPPLLSVVSDPFVFFPLLPSPGKIQIHVLFLYGPSFAHKSDVIMMDQVPVSLPYRA